MKYEVAMLKGLIAVKNAYREVAKRGRGVPGMMLVTGGSGAGKSTAINYLVNDTGGLYVRALATDTPVALLSRMIRLCGAVPNSTRGLGPMVEAVAEYLSNNELPLFVDEADHLLSNKKLIETVRDIYDLCNQPVVMIGYTGIEKRFADKPQIAGRVSQWINILPTDLEDADVLAETLCEVKVKPDLLEDMHRQCNGVVRTMVVGLSRIENAAKQAGVRTMDLESWGPRRKYFVNQIHRGI
jgi:hypothetical protein